MSISNQIKQILEVQNIKQIEFANRIKVDQSYISKLLSPKSTLTPSERVIDDICEAYNVNKKWLLTGEGEMFIEFSENERVLKIATDIINEDDRFMKNVLFTFSKLSDEQKEFLINLMKNMTQ